MSTRTRSAWITSVTMLAAFSTALDAQEGSKRLQPTTASEAAKSAFRAAIVEQQNVSPERALKRIDEALQADPSFGLAQVYKALLAPGMTGALRAAAISQKMGNMGSATPAEILLALYWREAAAGRGPAAVPMLRMVTEMVPDDAEIAYIYDGTQRAAKSEAEQVAALRRFTTRFPAHGAAYNQMGYTQWRTGDAEGALASMQQQMKVAPDAPNAHDSYADILLLMGRAAEAVPHVQREIELDPEFGGAYSKLGAAYLMTGDMNSARAQFALALGRAKTPSARIEALNWQATSHIYARDGRAAVQELGRAAEVATEAKMSGALMTVHARSAVIDAYMGDRKAVTAHLAASAAAAMNDGQRANEALHSAIALSRLGQKAEARAAASRFATLAPTNEVMPVIDAILALDAKDNPAAETAVAKLTGKSSLEKAARAELFMRTGRKAEGQALQREVLAASVKLEGNPPVDFFAVIARMRVAKL